MNSSIKIVLAGIILIFLSILPGIIDGWGHLHSIFLMFVIGIGGAWLERQGKF